MKGKHHKHPPIKRPTRGWYHKNEWAIYGTTCDAIAALFEGLNDLLKDTFRINYIDADHNVDTETTDLQIGKKKYQLTEPIHWNEYDDRLQPWSSDAAIVNGNHYPAQRQIVVLNPAKKDSLFRRIDQLTNINIIVTTDESDTPYDFLKPHISSNTKIIKLSEVKKIADYMSSVIEENRPILKAVVLAGGKSKRMGIDKSQIAYHDGVSQQLHMADICNSLGLETYLSKSHSEERDTIGNYKIIKDKIVDMGPFGGIVSAMMYDPDAAWLVLACDLPYMNSATIQNLIDLRNTRSAATAYKLDNQQFPEPLIAIYEPAIYQRMLRFLSLGYACPRKVLINSRTHIVPLANEAVAYNANTPDEMNTAQKTINKIG